MSRKISGKRLGLLLAIALPLALIAYLAVYWGEIQHGLKLPGRVGTAADQYFFDGQQIEPDFGYRTVTLPNGDVWKFVEADTNGQRSIPSWLIFMAQGPERQTLVYEARFDYSKMRDLFTALNCIQLRASDPALADERAKGLRHSPLHDQLFQAADSAAFSNTLRALGFRPTTLPAHLPD